MKGSWRWHKGWLYVIAYWRTREQLSGYSRSYGVGAHLHLWATKHVEVDGKWGRRAWSLTIGLRAKQ